MSEALVAVLAGGAGRRMGGAKPLAPLGGRPLIAWPLAAASAAGLRTVVVAKAATALPPVGVEVWLEPDEPQHPLTGLVHALERSGGAVVAVGCDQPWLRPELLARLAVADGCAAPLVDGVLQPLPARYPAAALGALRAGRDAQAAVRSVLAALEPEPVAIEDPRTIVNLNTLEELAAAERSVASPP